MSIRDLGTHTVELHDLGTLDIVGPGARLTLPAREAFELFQWLDQQKEVLFQHSTQGSLQESPDWLKESVEGRGPQTEELDLPVDEM